MEATKYLFAPIILVLLSGCASKSMVVSKRATGIEEGIVYSLPKQLVKVTYNRKRIDPTKAAEAIDSIKKSLKEKMSNEREVKRELLRSDLEGNKKEELKNKLTDIETTKLVLTINLYSRTSTFAAAIMKCAPSLERVKKAVDSALSEFSEAPSKINDLTKRTIEFADAIIECDQSLQPDEAFSEELIIKAEEPIPDAENTFYATIDHRIISSDALEISTENGLLAGAIGHSEDKTGDIIVSLAGSLTGLGIVPVPVPTREFSPRSKSLENCEEQEAISITQYIDPGEEKDRKALNKQLCKVCLRLDIDKPRTANLPKAPSFANGLIYRQPGTFTFKVERANYGNPSDSQEECVGIGEDIQVVSLTLAQGGQIGVLPFPRGFASKNEYDVSFSNGALSRRKIVRPSEALSAVNMVPNALKAMISVPAELLQLKVDYSSREKELLELKKAMLEAQTEVAKKQAELEKLKKENNAEP